MVPKLQVNDRGDLFRSHLEQLIDLNHPLAKLARSVDWERFSREFGEYYCPANGAPGLPTRLMAGMHYLKYAFDESDESVVARWVENPYWQYFCGCEYFQHEFPLHPTSLVKWRHRVGDAGVEKLLSETIETAKRLKALKSEAVRRVTVDTTVQEKAVAFPTDSRLYHTMREKLVDAAGDLGMKLRQTYRRKSKEALYRQSQARRARKPEQACRWTRKLKTWLGRVARDIRPPDRGSERHAESSVEAVGPSAAPDTGIEAQAVQHPGAGSGMHRERKGASTV
jgi:IS5 family transposase